MKTSRTNTVKLVETNKLKSLPFWGHQFGFGRMLQKLKFNLLYDKNSSLQKKIKLEQLKKEVS